MQLKEVALRAAIGNRQHDIVARGIRIHAPDHLAVQFRRKGPFGSRLDDVADVDLPPRAELLWA